MLPWYWSWSPQIHYPLSGSVVQDIEPNLEWFFAGIEPQAGVGNIEKEIFRKASYGKQLGLILDVLLPLVDEEAVDPEKSKRSLARLKEVYREIEAVKERQKTELEDSAVALLKRIEETDREMLDRIVDQFGQSGSTIER